MQGKRRKGGLGKEKKVEGRRKKRRIRGKNGEKKEKGRRKEE